MIEIYHNTLPVCILPKEEHKIDLDYELLCSVIEALEPTILATYPKTETVYKSVDDHSIKETNDELITRWHKYNLLNIHHPVLYSVFLIIMKGIQQFKPFIKRTTDPLYLQSWATLTRKNSKIHPHSHDFKWIGHLAVRAEPSTTHLKWLNLENEEIHADIENKNGQLILTQNVNHMSSIWLEDESRITIPFDIVDDDIWYKQEHMDKIKPPMFPIYIE